MPLILPPTTQPADAPVERRHAPTGSYARFRPCLRAEFGFSCAFCLLHESDIAAAGGEGWGLTSVEHFDTQSSHPERRDDYANCLYSCRRCNEARGAKPPAKNRRLLDPTATPWARHFRVVGDRLDPAPGDLDARYTEARYRLNDTAKVRARRQRREVLNRARLLLRDGVPRARALRANALTTLDRTRRAEMEEIAGLLERAVDAARADCIRAASVPLDAFDPCACSVGGGATLPAWLSAQCWQPTPGE